MPKNRHGLDETYFRKQLQHIVDHVTYYAPWEMASALTRLADATGAETDRMRLIDYSALVIVAHTEGPDDMANEAYRALPDHIAQEIDNKIEEVKKLLEEYADDGLDWEVKP